MNPLSTRLSFTLIVFLTVANLMVWGFLGVEKAYAQRVYPGIWVQTQPLAGMTKQQVIDRLEPINKAMLLEKVTLIIKDKEFQPTLAQLGYQVDTEAMAAAALRLGRGPDLQRIILTLLDYKKKGNIPIQYSIDQGIFEAYLNEIGKDITKEPKNMAFDYQEGNLIIAPAEEGITLDKNELKQAIQQQVQPGKTTRIVLNFHPTNPEIIHDSQVSQAKLRLTELLKQPLNLQAEEINETITPEKLFSLLYFPAEDNQLKVSLNEDKLQAVITSLAKKVDKKAVAQEVSAVNNTVIKEGEDGRQLDVPDATSRIKQRFEAADLATPLILKTTKIDKKVISISPEYVLGRHPGRYIEIDLSSQRMHLMEGDNYHRTFIISTGKWDMPTPIGEFQIHNHVKTAWSKRYGLYMDNWMAISSSGEYGIHQLPRWPGGKIEGTNHLGRPVSHGCVRLGPGDAEYVYDWSPNGTPVIIHQ